MELKSNLQNELTERITNVYNKYFGKSGITFINNILGDKDTIFINLYLANNDKELINGYKENDMFHIAFQLKVLGDNDYLLENLSKCYFITPQNEYLAYSRTELSFRKTKGNEDKIMASLERFIARLKEQLLIDLENNKIHKNHIELLKEKLGA